MSSEGPKSDDDYAMKLANESYRWYDKHANQSRIAYKVSETALLVLAASIPVAAVIAPDEAIVPAILGAVVVVLTGLRSVFHWHDNYLRWSGAREAIKTEHRLYRSGAAPYDDPDTRDMILAAAVTGIERDETAGWIKIASPRPQP